MRRPVVADRHRLDHEEREHDDPHAERRSGSSLAAGERDCGGSEHPAPDHDEQKERRDHVVGERRAVEPRLLQAKAHGIGEQLDPTVKGADAEEELDRGEQEALSKGKRRGV